MGAAERQEVLKAVVVQNNVSGKGEAAAGINQRNQAKGR